jgi:hypothetical protein
MCAYTSYRNYTNIGVARTLLARIPLEVTSNNTDTSHLTDTLTRNVPYILIDLT